MPVRTLEEIQLEVAQWSKENFGQQQSQVDPDLMLGSLAPLLGIMEEVGEYYQGGTEDDYRDALADIGIFLCDYAAREGFILPEPIRVLWKADGWHSEVTNLDAMVGLVTESAKLCQATLKRHQGIKGFDDYKHFESIRNLSVDRLIFYLVKTMEQEFAGDWLTQVGETWDKIVSKRNWTK